MSDVEVFTIGALLALMPGLVVPALLILPAPIDEDGAPALVGLKVQKIPTRSRVMALHTQAHSTETASEFERPMSDTWEWQIRIRRSGAGEYEDAEPQRDHRRPAELDVVVDVVVGGDHLRAMVGHVCLLPTICQVSVEEIEIAEIEGFSLEGQTEEKIWVKQSAGGHVVAFTISADGMGLTGESQVMPKPSSPLEREVITAPARRAAYEFLRKLVALRERQTSPRRGPV
jgi:hypothetical protein